MPREDAQPSRLGASLALPRNQSPGLILDILGRQSQLTLPPNYKELPASCGLHCEVLGA